MKQPNQPPAFWLRIFHFNDLVATITTTLPYLASIFEEGKKWSENEMKCRVLNKCSAHTRLNFLNSLSTYLAYNHVHAVIPNPF